MLRLLVPLALFAIAACSGDAPPQPVTNTVDPAIADALADPILVDPQLAHQANADAVQPADQPFSAPIPLGVPSAPDRATLGTLAKAAAGSNGCGASVQYSMIWAARLPQALALPAAAQVVEAAGSDTSGCRLRIVRYAIAATPTDTLGWWRSATTRAGYTILPTSDGALAARRTRDSATLGVSAYKDSVDVLIKGG